jgi:uncharacterized protein YodC (DUF2158 family)
MKPGDVIIAKMGGPKMTVEAVVDKPEQFVNAPSRQFGIHCVWFDQSHELRRGVFPPFAVISAPNGKA